MHQVIAVNARGIPIGEDAALAKYTNREVDQVLEMRQDGWTLRQIAVAMDMPKSTVHAICTGKIRGVVVDHWKEKR